MELIATISKVTSPKKGNKPNFDEAHVLLALSIIEKEQPIGRQLLTKKLGLSEATTRTMIKRLKELNLVKVDRVAGLLLTEEGLNLLSNLNSKIRIETNVYLDSIGWKCNAIIVKGGYSLINKIGLLNLRDLIIKQGAQRTIIAIINENNEIELPPKSFNESEEIKKLKEEIRKKIETANPGDLIIIFEPQDLHLAYKIVLSILNNA